MKSFSIFLFSILLITGCGNNPPILDTYEHLGEAYINFINNGAKLDDYKLLITTPEEMIQAVSKIKKLSNERVEIYYKESRNQLDTLDTFWNKKDFSNLLKLLPYKFISIRSNKIDRAGNFYNIITAEDKNGEIHHFNLSGAINLGDKWKIDFSNYVKDIQEIINVK